MNSSKLVPEADSQPLFLCPICLRKLQKALKFNLCRRYATLEEKLSTMVPCFVEPIYVVRDYGMMVGSEREDRNKQGGKICINVTREASEGYDIINVEYKQSGDSESFQHDCRFLECVEKLRNIITFLNRR